MTLADAKPLLLIVGVIASALAGGAVGTNKERGRGEVRAVQAKKDCDSTVRVVEVQRAAAVARVDSVIRYVEVSEMRTRLGASASALAVSRGRECRCPVAGHMKEKKPSFLSRWAPPLLGLGVGIAIGHSWAPRAVSTVVNVIGDGGDDGDDSRKGGHHHGKRWEPGKRCSDPKWHPRGKHRGHGKHDKD
jgi:hypothetical protein